MQVFYDLRVFLLRTRDGRDQNRGSSRATQCLGASACRGARGVNVIDQQYVAPLHRIGTRNRESAADIHPALMRVQARLAFSRAPPHQERVHNLDPQLWTPPA